MTDFDVVVIGAGPAGSTLAALLARAGRRVALVEKAVFPRRKVCGEFMSATSIAVIDRLGLGDEWRASAGPDVRRLALFAGEDMVAAPMPAAGRGGFGRALGRDRLDPALLRAAETAGAAILQPARASVIERQGEAHRVRIAGPEGETVFRAPVIVAAHGSWEPGPLPTNLPKRHAPGDHLGFKAYFRGARLARDLMPLLVFPGGYGGIVWADGGRLSLSCCIRRDALATLRTDTDARSASETVYRHLLRSCRGIRETIGEAVLDGAWLSAGPIRPGIRRGYDADIFRVGNAAGESHPIIAEGISMAIQSGWLLGQELARIDLFSSAARAAAGRRYEARWKAQFAARIHAAELFSRLAAGGTASRAIATGIRFAPRLLTLGAHLAGKTKPIAA